MRAADELAVKHSCELMCEPGRALVAEAESVIVRVDARRDHSLYINDGAFGTLFDAAYLGFRFPARLIPSSRRKLKPLAEFSLYGPTCDSDDHMHGSLPAARMRARGRLYRDRPDSAPMAACWRTRFNGFGEYDEVILTDEPMLSMYLGEEDAGTVGRATKSARA